MKCSVETCENVATRKGACLCEKHYMRLRRHGNALTVLLNIPDSRSSRNGTCKVDGCNNPIHCREFCVIHYKRFKETGEPGEVTRRKAFNGEGTINAYGYRVFSTTEGRILEHRQIVEKALGKKLPPGAVVHHLNGDRTDNRPCNLVVCPNEAYHKLLHKRQKTLKYSGPEIPPKAE